MPKIFALSDLHEELRSQEAALAEKRRPRVLERAGRIHRWLDEESLPWFVEAGEAFARPRVVPPGPGDWAWAAGVWWLAGDVPRARAALEHLMADGYDEEPGVHGVDVAGVLYVLGSLEEAARRAPESEAGLLARALLAQDVESARAAREKALGWIRHHGNGPDHPIGPAPLRDWDWVEETWRVESRLTGRPMPSYLEMMRASGALRDAGTEVAPQADRPEPVPGTLVRHDGAVLEVTSAESLWVDLAEGRHLLVLQQFGRWGVCETEDRLQDGEWVVEFEHGSFHEALGEAADRYELLHQRAEAVAIRALLADPSVRQAS